MVISPAEAQSFDPARAKSLGLRELSGKHVALYTDLPSSPEVDELPQVFDAAVPQWTRYFGVDEARITEWRMRGFLIVDMAKFRAAGAIPPSLPEFPHGYSIGNELWMFEQPSDYYRRHLLLHEATHGFMNTVLGGCGASWYMEGVAELLGTHRWQDGRLALGVMPADRKSVPYWGRVASIKTDVAAGRFRRFADLVNDDVRGFTDVPSYAWCWAFASFLDGNPHYQSRFRELRRSVTDPKFNDVARRLFSDDRATLDQEWLIFANELEYGTDVARTLIDSRPGLALVGTAKTTISADRGWQSTGVRLEAGRTYRVRATGRYQIAESSVNGNSKPWPCEPDGVTIRYYRGRPLGMLLGAVEPDTLAPGELPAMTKPLAIGLEAIITPTQSGTLYLRVNDSSAELHDNAGRLQVEIAEQKS